MNNRTLVTQQYNKENIGNYLYQRLPSYHRILDEQNNLLLKRFMEVLNEGFKTNSESLDKALSVVQASKCPEENLHILAKSLGADWIDTIHPRYQRTIVTMLTKLYKQKGTVDTIRFIASELSGFKAEVIEGEIPEEYYKPGDEKFRLLTIRLQAPELDDPVLAQQHESTISEVISKFVPVHTKYVLVVTYYFDEQYYRRIKEKDVTHLVQLLESTFNVPREEIAITEVIKYLFEEETNFLMLDMPEIGGLLTNPKYKLLENFYTTLTRHDILYHSKIKTLHEFSKVFDDVPEVSNKLIHNYGDYLRKVTDYTEDELIHEMSTLHSYDFKMPQYNTEDYEYDSKSKIDNGEDKLIQAVTKEWVEENKVSNLYTQDVNLDTKYNKSDRIMIKCILEDNKLQDLGLDTKVMSTNNPKSVLCSLEGRLSTPSYIDKIIKNDNTTYMYY